MASGKKPRHLVFEARDGKRFYYFKPSKVMLRAGFSNEPLGTNLQAAVARVNQLNYEWDQSRRTIAVPAAPVKNGSIGWLIDQFQSDKVFYLAKAPRTREEMDRAFTIIRAEFADFPIRALKRKHARAYYNGLLKTGSVHKAHYVMKWFSRLLNYGIELEAIEFNPLHKMQIEHPEPRTTTWTPDEINAVIGACLTPMENCGVQIPLRPSIALAVAIAYETSLPQQDIIALRWPQYDGEGLAVTQKKKRGSRDLYLPLSQEVRDMIEDRKRSTQIDNKNKGLGEESCKHIIINEETGQPYQGRIDFGKVFRKAKKRAGIARRVTFHDIRRTVLTELGNRGATNAEIVSMSGHSINSPVLRVYVRPDREAARRAAAKRKGRP